MSEFNSVYSSSYLEKKFQPCSVDPEHYFENFVNSFQWYEFFSLYIWTSISFVMYVYHYDLYSIFNWDDNREANDLNNRNDLVIPIEYSKLPKSSMTWDLFMWKILIFLRLWFFVSMPNFSIFCFFCSWSYWVYINVQTNFKMSLEISKFDNHYLILPEILRNHEYKLFLKNKIFVGVQCSKAKYMQNRFNERK